MMSSLQNHKIHTASLQVDFEGMEEGLRVQDSLGLFFYEKIQPALEKAFERYGDQNATLVFDKIELDCGKISYDNWEDDLLLKIITKLEENLKSPQIGKKEIVPVEKKAEEVFFYFLVNGCFPWNSPFSSPKDLEDALVLETSFLENLQRKAKNSPNVLNRLSQAFSSSFNSKLIGTLTQKLEPKHADLINFLYKSENSALQIEVIKVLVLLFPESKSPSTLSFLKNLIRRLSLSNLLQLADYLAREMVKNQDFHGIIFSILSNSTEPGTYKKSWKLWEKIQSTDPKIIQKLQKISPKLDFKNLHFSLQPESMPFNKTLANGVENSTSNYDEILNKEDISLENEGIKQIPDEIYIENAGLVLLHPFMEGLFSSLQLTENGKFNNENDQSLAARTLHYLVYGENDQSENFYPLNKILCGMGIPQVLGDDVKLSKKFQDECEELLQEVIGHWSVLKNTSIDGLRETFLQRKGKICRVDKGWKLKVELRAVDVLLAKLPWGVGIVKLPWMTDMMFVEWD